MYHIRKRGSRGAARAAKSLRCIVYSNYWNTLLRNFKLKNWCMANASIFMSRSALIHHTFLCFVVNGYHQEKSFVFTSHQRVECIFSINDLISMVIKYQIKVIDDDVCILFLELVYCLQNVSYFLLNRKG